jgi:hypothetical protein
MMQRNRLASIDIFSVGMDPGAGEVATLHRSGTGRDGVASRGIGHLRLVRRQFITASENAQTGLQNRSTVNACIQWIV